MAGPNALALPNRNNNTNINTNISDSSLLGDARTYGGVKGVSIQRSAPALSLHSPQDLHEVVGAELFRNSQGREERLVATEFRRHLRRNAKVKDWGRDKGQPMVAKWGVDKG